MFWKQALPDPHLMQALVCYHWSSARHTKFRVTGLCLLFEGGINVLSIRNLEKLMI